MPFENYVILVALAALVYSGIARYVQNRLIDKKMMTDVQEESKRLSAEYKEATKSNDKVRMDAIMKQQVELLPKMNKVMLGQFKPMVVVLIVFLAFNWVISAFDPSKSDDIALMMKDDGKGCDLAANDSIYSACYDLTGMNYGKWVVTVKAFSNGGEIGSNSTYFLYNIDNTTDTYLDAPKGDPVGLHTDKAVYYPGDQVKITADAPGRATSCEATLNSGSSFYVDLPFTIPLINVQRLHEPYWWFIFVALISGILVSVIYGRMQKAGLMK